MKKMSVRILTVAAGVLAMAVIICGIIFGVVWNRYEPPQKTGYYVSDRNCAMSEASEEWFESYMNELTGWRVPRNYRIKEAQLDSIETLEDDYVQLNYTIWPFFRNAAIVRNLGLISTEEKSRYQAQVVLKWEKANGTWVVTEALSPVQYQIRSPEMQEEIQQPQTKHYKMQTDEKETYYVEDGILYVTYDGGESLREVPDGYESICRDANGSYHELLPYNSYVITPEFTGFVGFGELIYSMDQGKSWQKSSIWEGRYKANTFLSRTENYCYVTLALDRSLGSDYYATFRTQDFETWNQVNVEEVLLSNLNCVYWSDDNTGYYSKGEDMFYVTRNAGESYQQMEYPEAQEIVGRLGFNPFDTVEKMYQEEGALYMVVGQGDDGDYARDGEIVKALYRSEDGTHFTFEEEITDTPEEAG